MTTNLVLEMNGVSKRYEHFVLESLDLCLPEGPLIRLFVVKDWQRLDKQGVAIGWALLDVDWP